MNIRITTVVVVVAVVTAVVGCCCKNKSLKMAKLHYLVLFPKPTFYDGSVKQNL